MDGWSSVLRPRQHSIGYMGDHTSDVANGEFIGSDYLHLTRKQR